MSIAAKQPFPITKMQPLYFLAESFDDAKKKMTWAYKRQKYVLFSGFPPYCLCITQEWRKTFIKEGGGGKSSRDEKLYAHAAFFMLYSCKGLLMCGVQVFVEVYNLVILCPWFFSSKCIMCNVELAKHFHNV